MSLEELVGILIVHEQILQGDEKTTKGMNLTLKAKHKGKKCNSCGVLEETEDESDESDFEGDEELTLITLKLKRNSKKLGYEQSKRFIGKDKEKVVCFKCKKLMDYNSECSELTNKEKDKKKEQKTHNNIGRSIYLFDSEIEEVHIGFMADAHNNSS